MSFPGQAFKQRGILERAKDRLHTKRFQFLGFLWGADEDGDLKGIGVWVGKKRLPRRGPPVNRSRLPQLP